MKHDKKNISKLLANLIISSFALSGGVVPSMAMEYEQQPDRVPTQHKLADTLRGLPDNAQMALITIARAFLLKRMDGRTQYLNTDFYRNLKKTVVIDYEGLAGMKIDNFDMDCRVPNNTYDKLLPSLKIYLAALNQALDETGLDVWNDINDMLAEGEWAVSKGMNASEAVKNFTPPEFEMDELIEPEFEMDELIEPEEKAPSNSEIAADPLVRYEFQHSDEPVSTKNWETCPICTENFESTGRDILTTPCHHSFHEDCMAMWAMNSRTHDKPRLGCPMCRNELPLDSVLTRSEKVKPS